MNLQYSFRKVFLCLYLCTPCYPASHLHRGTPQVKKRCSKFFWLLLSIETFYVLGLSLLFVLKHLSKMWNVTNFYKSNRENLSILFLQLDGSQTFSKPIVKVSSKQNVELVKKEIKRLVLLSFSTLYVIF